MPCLEHQVPCGFVRSCLSSCGVLQYQHHGSIANDCTAFCCSFLYLLLTTGNVVLTMQVFSSGFWLCKVPALMEMFTGARSRTRGVQKLHEISVHCDVRDFNSSAHKAYPKMNQILILYKAHEFLLPDIFAKCAFRFCSSFTEMFSEV